MSDVTQILDAVARGNQQAVNELFPLVYNELRQMASQKMMEEKPGQTLQPTALVHEAFVRMVGSTQKAMANRQYFFAAAAEAMRRILVDNARRKLSAKRGGAAQQVHLSDVAAPEEDERLVALDEQLTKLALENPQAARVVELYHFVGLSYEQIAEALHTSVYEIRLKWAFARAWLKASLDFS